MSAMSLNNEQCTNQAKNDMKMKFDSNTHRDKGIKLNVQKAFIRQIRRILNV